MLDIVIDKSAGKPLYVQIRDAFKSAVDTNVLKPGERIPTVNALARQIGVTPSTIRRAFKDLGASGYTHCHVGRGTFVASLENRQTGNDGDKSSRPFPVEKVTDSETVSAAWQLRSGIKSSLDALMVLAGRPGLIRFTDSHVHPQLIEQNTLKKMTDHALKSDESAFYFHGGACGLPELRKTLADRFSATGTSIKPDQILITNGSQQAISLLAQFALKEKLRVICETPGYMGIFKSFENLGHWVESLPRNETGPPPDRLARFTDGKASLFYFCPRLHNPMGTDISPERKRMLLDWSNKHNVTLVSDEIFSDFYYEGAVGPGFLPEIGNGNVFVTGSPSKTFINGLRVGWVVSTPENIMTLIQLKRLQDLSTPPLNQGIINSLFVTGEYDLHLTKIRKHYKMLRDEMVAHLEKEMPSEVTWIKPRGGLHFWISLPRGYSSIALFLLAIENGVSFIPGPLNDVDHRFINSFNLRFGGIEKSQIKEGISLLAQSVRQLLNEPPGDHGLSGIGVF